MTIQRIIDFYSPLHQIHLNKHATNESKKYDFFEQ